MSRENPEKQDAPARTATEPNAPVVTSAELMCGGREVFIEHDGATYRLFVTGNGKLLMNKYGDR